MSEKLTAKIEQINGRNVFSVNGKPISYAAYADPIIHGGEDDWLARIRDFVESGVKIFTLAAPPDDPAWVCGGKPLKNTGRVSIKLDRQVELVKSLLPDALFFVRFGDIVPDGFADENLGHMQKPSNAGDEFDGTFMTAWYEEPQKWSQVSLASKLGQEMQNKQYETLINHCESRPWADRLIGYQILAHGEGVTLINVAGHMFDCCDEMQAAFKEWVKRNYADEAALSRAWNDETVSFESVRVPTDDEWRLERKTAFQWADGKQFAKMRDYFKLQRELFMECHKTTIRRIRALLSKRPVLFGIDMAKQPMLGWQHNLAFFGYGLNEPGHDCPNIITASGGCDIGELLDEPGLDMLVTPADYTARTVGYAWEAEGIAESMRIRGKALYAENDARTFNPGQEDHTIGAFNTPDEVNAGFLRNAAWSLTRGQMDYWMIAGGKYFHHPVVQEKGVRAARPLSDLSPSLPYAETEHAVAMVIDDFSPMYENGTSGFQNLSVLWQRMLGLAHCGIPYRLYLFSDLEKDAMPDYRCYLFPNMFYMDEKRMDLLKSKIFKNGKIAVFGPATGITDGSALSAGWASRVLGVEMELVRRESPRRVIIGGSHPIVKNIPSNYVYGDSFPYGPVIIPAKGAVERAGGCVLGESTTFFLVNRPGLFVRDAGDYKVAWSVAAPIPACLLRELARFGGCHVWCEDDEVVQACGNVASIHTAKAGTKTLKLPFASTVDDLVSGKKVGERLGEIKIEMSAPETRIFAFQSAGGRR